MARMTTWVFGVTASALAIGSCGGSGQMDARLEAPVLTSARWHVSGTEVVDDLGRELVLRGFNVGGRTKMPPFMPFELDSASTLEAQADDFFARLEALSANAVRLGFSWEALEPVEGTYDAEYVRRYRVLMDAARAHGISVLVDFHQDVYASPFCGDGFPVWTLGPIPHGAPHYDCGFPAWSNPAFDPTSPVSAAFDRVYQNQDGLLDKLVAMWVHMAEAVGDHPAFGAYDMFNEPAAGSIPYATFDSVNLTALHERIGVALTTATPGATVFGHGRIGDSIGSPSSVVFPSIPTFAYSPHYYHPLVILGFDILDEADLRRALTTTLAPAVAAGVPTVIGELGVPNTSPIKAEYLSLVLDILDETQTGLLLWEATASDILWNSEDFSVLDGEGNETPGSEAMVRAYPRAVAGHVERFSYDARTHHFELEVSDAADEVTEIELPGRWYRSPRVRVEGPARYRFDRARHRLLVRADEVASSYRVDVDP